MSLSLEYVNDVVENEDWITTMNEEIYQIEKNNTWTLVPRPKEKNGIGTKWFLGNKLNEKGEVVRNKERLACKGNAQVEGSDYGETCASIARLEGVITLLAYTT